MIVSVQTIGGIRLPLCDTGLTYGADRPVILGIRPEHFNVAAEGSASIEMIVDHVELLGADTLVYGHCGTPKTMLTVRLPDVHHFKKHTTLSLVVDSAKLHLFDRESGKRLRAH
jgi:sn-glycerol 3-phosphate transport system ATP-binding protein